MRKTVSNSKICLAFALCMVLILNAWTTNAQNKVEAMKDVDLDDIGELLSIKIPDSVSEYAEAVVRHYSVKYIIDSESKMTMEVKKVITIPHSGGDEHGNFYGFYDDATKISGFKAFVYDKNGERVSKYNKGDLRDYSFSPWADAITDSRLLALQMDYTSYPYTIVYEYEKTFKDLFDIPDWHAIDSYKEGVLDARLVVENNSGIPLRFHSRNLGEEIEVFNQGNQQMLQASVENLKPLVKEPFSDPLHEITPGVKLVLTRFSYDGESGELSSWQDIGDWINQISEGRGHLPPHICQQVERVTSGLNSKKEKIKAIYKFMQDRSRYVSIQLGIGGWQPFEATFVHEKGYGDCKALSFYTRSLLLCAGIESIYTLVYAGDDPVRLNPAFPANQFNHVILAAPLDNDTVWLECTSMNQPFNYLGSFTHGRKALMIGKKLTSLVNTPSYTAEQNLKLNKGEFVLDEEGNLQGSLVTTYEGLRYDLAQKQMSKGQEELEKDFTRALDFSGCSVDEIKVERTDEGLGNPEGYRQVKMSVGRYGKKSGKRIFLKPNFEERHTRHYPAVKERDSDIVVDNPVLNVDTLVYQIPEGFTFEYVPGKVTYESEFGLYEQIIIPEDNKLTFTRKFLQPKGRYSPAKYDEFAAFKNKIVKSDDRSVVLVSEE